MECRYWHLCIIIVIYLYMSCVSVCSYDLVGVDNGFRFNYTTGFAYIRSMCNTEGYSISVVEDHGGFQSVGTAAHEIGHSLGAEHDGTNNTCVPRDRFVMAPLSFNETEANKYNPWFFSTCSVESFIKYINDVIDKPGRQACFIGSLDPEAGIPNITGQMPGQLYIPDVQCQQLYGETSYLCRGTGFDVNRIICRAMFCYVPETDTCVLMTAARGTTCGNKMWCLDGACVESNNAPETDATCPHGDQPYVIVNNNGTKTSEPCNTTVFQSPGLCYDQGWSRPCCTSCKQVCDGPPDCRCRDHQNICVEADCGRYNATILAKCCYTCRYFDPTTTSTSTSTSTSTTSTSTTSTSTSTTSTSTTPTPTTTTASTCTDVTTFEGVTCSTYLQNAGQHMCYTDLVNRSCCETCRNKINTIIDNCQWGDQTPSSCYLFKSFPPGSICPQSDDIILVKCCQTCYDLQRAISIPVGTTTTAPTDSAVTVVPSLSVICAFGVVIYHLQKSYYV